jgi:hypothetical protein
MKRKWGAWFLQNSAEHPLHRSAPHRLSVIQGYRGAPGEQVVSRTASRSSDETETQMLLWSVMLWSAGTTASAQSAAAKSTPPQITFFVYFEDPKGPIVGRQQIEVSRVGRDGVLLLGRTNGDGEVTLKTEDVFTAQAIALLFCDPRLKEHCTALRVDSNLLKGFAEYNVELSIFKLIDRMRIKRKGL